MLMKIKPNMYVKSILDINYNKLKENGINILFYDFDNTLIERGNYTLNSSYLKLLKTLKKDFNIMVVSNSIHKSKLEKVCNKYDLDYVMCSFKPFSFGFKKAMKKLNVKSNNICVIGDQLLTDIKGAINMGYYSVLVDPINYDEHILTKFNRVRERKIFKRGNYYE